MFKDIDFNENEPNPNNIDFVFSKILFCLISASIYEDYANIKNKIKTELNNLIKLLAIYTNTKNLLTINIKELNNIAIKISTLDGETIARNGIYLEMADIWLSILIGYYNFLEKEEKYGKR